MHTARRIDRLLPCQRLLVNQRHNYVLFGASGAQPGLPSGIILHLSALDKQEMQKTVALNVCKCLPQQMMLNVGELPDLLLLSLAPRILRKTRASRSLEPLRTNLPFQGDSFRMDSSSRPQPHRSSPQPHSSSPQPSFLRHRKLTLLPPWMSFLESCHHPPLPQRQWREPDLHLPIQLLWPVGTLRG